MAPGKENLKILQGGKNGSSDPSDAAGPESMTSQAYSRLRQDIISGTLKPGQKLKIEELRVKYVVGTSPIREALSLLTSDQFVERIDQRGFKVASVSVQEFDELLKTRCWLEEMALRESIASGSSSWEEHVVLANYRLSRIPRSESSAEFISNSEWEDAHKQFHMTLISECGSSMLLKFCDQLYDQNVRYRQISGSAAYPIRNIAEEHNAICDAVLSRDGELACALLVSHYNQTSTFVRDQLIG